MITDKDAEELFKHHALIGPLAAYAYAYGLYLRRQDYHAQFGSFKDWLRYNASILLILLN